MQNLMQCVRLASNSLLNKMVTNSLLNKTVTNNLLNKTVTNSLPALFNRGYADIPYPRPRALSIEFDEDKNRVAKQFLSYNDKVYPPTKAGEERRPGYVCYAKERIKYSPLKMWYIACFVRGMTVDEAIKQLSFMHKKGAAIVKQAILEAQEEAVKNHNIEYKSNMWIAESFVTKSLIIKGMRKHSRGRVSIMRYRFCHYFVRLEEGTPPKNYYLPYPKTGEQMLEDWKKQMHKRNIPNTL